MKKEIEVFIPSVPNFIQVGKGATPLGIEMFTEAELRQIGKDWTEKLVEVAKEKR